MRLAATIEDQSGYTLLETVVAMALLVSVLIPLGAAVGKLMLGDSSDMIYQALRVAESEMCSVDPNNEVDGRTSDEREGFRIIRDVSINGDLVQVKVTVTSSKKSERHLGKLQKTFLAYR